MTDSSGGNGGGQHVFHVAPFPASAANQGGESTSMGASLPSVPPTCRPGYLSDAPQHKLKEQCRRCGGLLSCLGLPKRQFVDMGGSVKDMCVVACIKCGWTWWHAVPSKRRGARPCASTGHPSSEGHR